VKVENVAGKKNTIENEEEYIKVSDSFKT